MIACAVEEIATIDDLERLAPEWRTLYRQCPADVPPMSRRYAVSKS